MIRRLIILLLIVGCGTEPEDVYGCTVEDAATDDDGGCLYGEYAAQHWSFSRWLKDYYKWYNHVPGDSSWNSIRSVFINSSDSTSGCAQDPTQGQCYMDIWDNSHSIEFTWNGGRVSTNNGGDFQPIYQELCGNQYIWDTACLIGEVELNDSNGDSIFVIKDHHFYYGIGKYDIFTAGWDDTDSIYVITNNDGSKTAMTPHKLHYRELMNISE
ncbi:MAG: hypothetical protein QF380_06780 [Candidatus Marinimicrobia bacterium]|jgi:hypothetical protein|nr:hypothetical protein [Candidatus Neomarinimicrobiota bacterium]